MNTGQKIKEIRLRRNLTQEYMADQLGITTQGYGRIENNKSEPTLANLKKIAKELGVSVGHLADDEGVIFNNYNYGEVKEKGSGNNILYPVYNQENSQAIEILKDEVKNLREEVKFWRDKYEQDIDYYKSLLDRMLGQK